MFNTEKLKKEIKENKISQIYLAKAIGIPYSTLNDKVNGKTKLTVDEAYKITKILSKRIEDFYS